MSAFPQIGNYSGGYYRLVNEDVTEGSFLDLPKEVIQNIGLRLGIRDIANLCKTNRYINLILCENDHFWKLKYLRDIGEPENKVTRWKEAYEDLYDVSAYAIGNNLYGNLGVGDIPTVTHMMRVPKVRPKAISIGEMHTLFLDWDGKVWTSGNNRFGMMGLPEVKVYPEPVLIPNLPRMKSISAGYAHSLFIDLQDEVWVVGTNLEGELGLGEAIERQFTPVPLGMKAKAVAAGSYHSLVLDNEGTVWGFGHNGFGQLGLGHTQTQFRPVPMMSLRGKAKDIFAGQSQSAIIDTEGKVWMLGHIGYRLGDSPVPIQITNFKAKSVALGSYHVVVLDQKGTVWVAGSNDVGQIGLHGVTEVNVLKAIPNLKAEAISAGSSHTAIMDCSGTITIFGDIVNLVSPRERELKIYLWAKSIASGKHSFMAIKNNPI